MKVSDRLVNQRMRNRQIEAMGCLESAEAMAEMGVFESLNTWDDFHMADRQDWYVPPVYSPKERDALVSVNTAVDAVCESVVEDCWEAEKIQGLPGILDLFKTARAAKKVFELRGRFDEEIELTDEALKE